MDRGKLKKLVTLGDLKDDMRDVAEIVGVENAVKLMEYFGGSRVYFKLLDEALAPVQKRAVLEAFHIQGKDLDTIRREFQLAESTVREYIFGNPDTRQIPLIAKMG